MSGHYIPIDIVDQLVPGGLRATEGTAMTQQRSNEAGRADPDPIIGARQAAEVGPQDVAPIVMWSYLAALVKEYDALSARAERAEAQIRAVEAVCAKGERLSRSLRSQERAEAVAAAVADVRAALAAGLSLQEEQE